MKEEGYNIGIQRSVKRVRPLMPDVGVLSAAYYFLDEGRISEKLMKIKSKYNRKNKKS